MKDFPTNVARRFWLVILIGLVFAVLGAHHFHEPLFAPLTMIAVIMVLILSILVKIYDHLHRGENKAD